MLKNVTYNLAAFLLIFYIVIAINFIGPTINNEKCSNVSVEILSEDSTPYLNSLQIRSFLDRFNLNPIGKNMSDIDTRTIKDLFQKHKLIKKTEVYKTIGSVLKIKVQQRTPILRVMSEYACYYVDSEQKIMPIPSGFLACLPVATGNISKKYARKQLYSFAVFLKKNTFWHAQIDQIYVHPNLEIELVPHFGKHCILLGKIDHFEDKLDNLKLFYKQCLNTIGWNRYSTINLKYNNQIVCTKID